MVCLWNGEYGEHDLSFASGLGDILKHQEQTYKQYIGVVVGDFTCERVEYDWGRRDQRWTVKCNLCGKTMYQYHTQDWRRGKGRKTTCSCRLERERQLKEDAKKDRLEKILQKKKDHLGKTYGGWKVIEYGGFERCKVECAVCGKKRGKVVRIENVISESLDPCNHKIPKDYSGEEWIGRRAGNLTVVGRDGGMFVARCDCGKEIIERPSVLFTSKSKTDCGDLNCAYAEERKRAAREKAIIGHEYERRTEEMLKRLGYNAKRTKCYSDFGVDIIITEPDGTKVAIQCKKQDGPAGVSAVQEVYAGGRYYDCEKFAVVCDTGFSNNAIIMARKLGVYLCEKEFSLPENIDEYAINLLPVCNKKEKLEKLYELNGIRHTIADWAAIYGTTSYMVKRNMKRGMSLEIALNTKERDRRKQYTVNGFTGTLQEVCDHYGIISQTVSYRMKQRGMTIEEAVLTPTKKTS